MSARDMYAARAAGFVGRYVTAARFIGVMAIVCFLIAWNRDMALLYGLCALLIALLLVSWILPFWALRRLRVVRHQTGTARAGGQVSISYRFVATRPLYFLTVTESIQGAERQSHFIPHADLREPQTLLYHAPQRGVFELSASEVSSSWPFGFIRQKRRVAVSPAAVTVVPRVHRINRLPQTHAEHAVMEGADSFLSRGLQSEFAGVRPYRDGDSMKHVHWGASARRQSLVVREYHSFDRPSWLMVLDARAGVNIGEGADSFFEYSLEIAASMLEYARQQGIRMLLYINCAQPVRLAIEPGAPNSLEYLEILAAVRDDGTLPYQQAVTQALTEQSDFPVLITVRRDSQTLSVNTRGGHLDVVYNDASFETPMGRYAEGWKQQAPDHFMLHLHRLSSLSQVLSS